MSYRDVVLADRPSALWPFDDASGGPINFGNAASAIDDSLVVSGSLVAQTRPLVVGEPQRSYQWSGGKLTGNSGSPYSSHAGASGKMCWEAVIYPTQLANAQWIMTKGTASAYEYGLQVTLGGAIEMTTYTSSGAADVSDVTSTQT